MRIYGITDDHVRSAGSTEITFFDKIIKFQVMTSPLPINAIGILGVNFLKQESAILNFHFNSLVTESRPVDPIPFDNYENKLSVNKKKFKINLARTQKHVLPARSRTVLELDIKPTTLKHGYLPIINSPDNVFIGEAVVRNMGNRCCVRAINATDSDVELDIEPQELEDFDYASSDGFYSYREDEPRIRMTPEERYERVMEWIKTTHLNEEETNHVTEIIRENTDLFRLPGEFLPATDVVQHRIPTVDDVPVFIKPYRYSPAQKEEIASQVKKLLDKQIIQPSKSPYNSPLVIVPKKADSKGNKQWRMVVDYRSLNSKTIGDAHPLPNITEILDRLGGAQYFTVIDLASGFHQVEVAPEDRHKTSFSTPLAHYEFVRMPFGLKGAPAMFQRLMNTVLLGLQDEELFVYLDDIVLFAQNLEEHQAKVKRVFKRLRDAKLSIQPEKCVFLSKSVEYLGHIITPNGVFPNPSKTEAVRNFPRPKTQTNIRQFLGLAGFYRRFITNFSSRAKPLSDLTKKTVKFEWGPEQEKSFQDLKNALCTAPILQYPDFNRPFILTTDASNFATGAVLSQGELGSDKPIAYMSKIMKPA